MKDRLSPSSKKEGALKSVFIAYLILLLHVILLGGLIAFVIFFRGVVNYMLWIFLSGLVILGGGVFWIYRRIKKDGQAIRKVVSSPIFQGQTVEISLLGGLASVKVDRSHRDEAPPVIDMADRPLQLEAPDVMVTRQLIELARLYENQLISEDEYNRIKDRLFKQME